MKTLGIIPARSGSKRLPDKNIKLLDGKPLLCYTFEAAQGARLLDDIVLSTDAKSIQALAESFERVKAPFLRPAYLADDQATDFDVIQHALNYFKQEEKKDFDIGIYLRPTSPFKTSEMIDRSIEKLSTVQGLTGVRSVTAAEGVFHPYWAYRLSGDYIEPFIAEGGAERFPRSQLLPNCVRLNGVVDSVKVSAMSKEKLYGDKTGYIEIPASRALDIDTSEDFLYAEFLLEQMKRGRF